MVGQQAHCAVRIDGEQTFHGVRGDHSAVGIERESQHAPAGAGEHLLMGAIGIHAQQVAAGHGRVELAVGPDCHVLRAELAADADRVQFREARIGRVRPDETGRRRRIPCNGLRWNRPQTEIAEHAQDQQREPTEPDFFSLSHVTSMPHRYEPHIPRTGTSSRSAGCYSVTFGPREKHWHRCTTKRSSTRSEVGCSYARGFLEHDARAALVAVHGFNSHGGYYERLAIHPAEQRHCRSCARSSRTSACRR